MMNKVCDVSRQPITYEYETRSLVWAGVTYSDVPRRSVEKPDARAPYTIYGSGNAVNCPETIGTSAVTCSYVACAARGASAEDHPHRLFLSNFEYYYGHRYYNPGLGRWASRDVAGEMGSDVLLDLSEEPDIALYEFVLNDPANQVDILGLARARLSGLASGGISDIDKEATIRGTCGELYVTVSIDATASPGRNIGSEVRFVNRRAVGILVHLEWTPGMLPSGAPACCCASVKWEQYYRETDAWRPPGLGTWVRDSGFTEIYDPAMPCTGSMMDYPYFLYRLPGQVAYHDEFVTFLRMTDSSGTGTDAAVIQWDWAALRPSTAARWQVVYNVDAQVL
jgi:RHS repeat-associated protein